MQAKVSIIIPVYNCEKYIRQCLDSLVAQTLSDIEIICVNDGSTDSSLEILREYEKKDYRIKAFSQEKSNAGKARNKGIDLATGEYFIFLDSDDYFEINMLEEAVAQAENFNSEITIFGAEEFDDTTNEVIRSYTISKWLLPQIQPFSAQDVSANLFQLINPAPWNKLYNASFIKKSNVLFQELSNSNDFFFTTILLSKAEKICYIDKSFVHYRSGNKNSTQSTKAKEPLNFYKALKAVRDRLTEDNRYGLFMDSFSKLVDITCAYNFNSLTETDLSDSERKNIKEELTKDTETENPSVSVIIPPGGSSEDRERTLESILSQENIDFEIVYVTDSTSYFPTDILESLKKKHEKISTVTIDKSPAGFYGKKAGVEAAKGEYTVFVNPGDELLSGALSQMYKSLRENDLDVGQFKKITADAFKDSSETFDCFNQVEDKEIHSENIIFYFFMDRFKDTGLTGKIFRSELCRSVFSRITDYSCDDNTLMLFICIFANRYKGFPQDNVYRAKAGRYDKYGNDLSESFETLCNKSKNKDIFINFAKDGEYSENAKTAFNNLIKYDLEDCCHRLTDHIKQGERRDAALLMRKNWSGFDFYDGVLKETMNLNVDFFDMEYIENYYYNKEFWENSALKKPLISVIIPAYNSSKYIGKCIESVIGQTLKDIEIICINDGSTDNTFSIIREYAQKDDRIGIISKENGGQSSARNLGIRMAHGKYIYFLDSDDYLETNALEELYSLAESEKLDILYFGAESFFENEQDEISNPGYIGYYHRTPTGKITADELVDRYTAGGEFRVSVPLQFYNGQFLRDSGISFTEGIIYEDEVFSAEALAKAQNVRVISEEFYHRRVHSNSTMTSRVTAKQVSSRIIVSLKLLDIAKDYKNSSAVENFLINRGKENYNTAKRIAAATDNEEIFNTIKSFSLPYAEIFKESALFINNTHQAIKNKDPKAQGLADKAKRKLFGR